MDVAFFSNKIKKIYSDPKKEGIVKTLWYFVVLLDFFFSIVKLGEPKFTVSHTIFFCCIFAFFLMRNFKTNNNFSSKICCENAVDVKNKIIKYQTETYHSWK